MKQQPQCASLLPNPDLSPNLLHLKDKLASINRSRDGDQVEAVVAILLWDEPGRGLQTLLVQRAEREGDAWSGQIGLPGGRVKQGTETPRTALHREVEEEVGIKLEEVGGEPGRAIFQEENERDYNQRQALECGVLCCRRKDRLGFYIPGLD